MNPLRKTIVGIASTAYVAAALAFACSDDPKPSEASNVDAGRSNTGSRSKPPPVFIGRARIRPTGEASTARGTAEFVDGKDGTVVTISVRGVDGMGERGVHIHEKANCETTDAGAAMGAGAHWNPTDAGHGLPTFHAHHVGDLGNITIDSEGRGTLTLTSKDFNVNDAGPRSVLGRSVILHAWSDDGISSPAGNSGARVGCGIIEAEEVE